MDSDTNSISLDFVIANGIRFLESLTRHYGPEKGHEVWEAMGDALGREIKGKIFFAMIAGNHTTSLLKFSSTPSCQGVPIIKAIREYTNISLSEAKDIWDRSKIGNVDLTVDVSKVKPLARKLMSLNCKVYY